MCTQPPTEGPDGPVLVATQCTLTGTWSGRERRQGNWSSSSPAGAWALHTVCRRPHNLSVPNRPAPRRATALVLSAGDICSGESGSPGRQHLLRVRNSDGELLPFLAVRSPVAAIGAFWKTPLLTTTAWPWDPRCPLIAALGQHSQTLVPGGSRHRQQPPAPGPESLLSEELQHRRGGRGGRTGQVETLRCSRYVGHRGGGGTGVTSPSCPS